MNRLPTLMAAPTPPRVSESNPSSAIDNNATFRLAVDFAHRVFLPTHFTPTYDYPLVVWLHSDLSSEMELDSVMNALSDQNYLAVAPRANVRSEGKSRLYRWGNTRADYAFAEDVVWECILSSIEQLPVDPSRVFIAGFGAGGTLAQWIGLQYPERIAGVVSLSGASPTHGGSLTSWKLAKELPILFSQRRGSSLCSHSDLQNAIRMAHRAGLNYTFWQLHSEEDSFGESDDLSTEMLAAANRFMMGIVTQSPVDLAPTPNRDHLVGPFGIN